MMRARFLVAVVCAGSAVFSVACGSATPKGATDGVGPAPERASPIASIEPSAGPGPSPAEATTTASDIAPKPKEAKTTPAAPTAPPTPPKRERFRIHNSCSKPVKLRIERVSDSDLDTTLTNQSEKEERGSDGDEVRLMGDSNNIVHAIKIEPWMKLIDVTQSCTKLEGK